MIKVTIQKQNEIEIEFIKTTELQVLPNEGETLTIDGNDYVIKTINHAENQITITVKDKHFRRKRFW